VTNLATFQRELASLLRGEAAASDEDYFREVERSVGLDVARYSVASWRQLLLRQATPLTIAALTLGGRLEEAFRGLAIRATSAYVEKLACEFLDDVTPSGDTLLRAVAQFEKAMIQGADETIEWPCEPYSAIAALLRGEEPEEDGRKHVVIVSGGRFRVA